MTYLVLFIYFFAIKKPILGIGFTNERLIGKYLEQSESGKALGVDVEQIIDFLKNIKYNFKQNETFTMTFSRETQALNILKYFEQLK